MTALVTVPIEPPFPKGWKVIGQACGFKNGRNRGKTVTLGWTEEGGGWFQWGLGARIFYDRESAEKAASKAPGPWYSLPIEGTVEVVEVDSTPDRENYRAMVKAGIEALEGRK